MNRNLAFGTVNLLRALSSSAPNARFLFISTAQVYGGPSSIESGLVDEDAPALPMTFYSISKEAAERAVMAYSSIYGLDAFIARPANHTGPGQSTRFVAASFAEQAKKILRGEASSYVTGNLKSVRDFTDVRDVVRAYRLLIERGRRGEIYNISSGTLVSIGELLECIKKISGAGAPSSEDPSLIRPTDSSRRLNTAKLRETTGWEPSLSLSDTLRDMLV